MLSTPLTKSAYGQTCACMECSSVRNYGVYVCVRWSARAEAPLRVMSRNTTRNEFTEGDTIMPESQWKEASTEMGIEPPGWPATVQNINDKTKTKEEVSDCPVLCLYHCVDGDRARLLHDGQITDVLVVFDRPA